MSSIPRGNSSTDAHHRLIGINGGHPSWREHCWAQYWAPVREDEHGQLVHELRTRYDATDVHAEDNAINMYFAARDSHPDRIWLGNGMVVYGLHTRFNRRTGPGQVLPCANADEDPYNHKTPCCRDVLDRLNIQWRYGIGAAIAPASRLPELPPNQGGSGGYGPGGGSGGGSGGSGGGEHPPSGYQQRTSDLYGTDISVPSSMLDGGGPSGSAHAAARRGVVCRAPAAETGTNKGSASSHPKPTHTASAVPPRNKTQPVALATKQPGAASLTHSLANLSLGGKKPPAPSVGNAVAANPRARPTPSCGGGKLVRQQQEGDVHPASNATTPAPRPRPGDRPTPATATPGPHPVRVQRDTNPDKARTSHPDSTNPPARARQDKRRPAGSSTEQGRPVQASTQRLRTTTSRADTLSRPSDGF
ncbi:hypothetical protein C8A05DRAFT_39085 [Staphylotrichum tortipilum]|uniref:Uncharacterized protein n=1 Tax=Staphylotrichum tortipilum TaxID=2831512 RepID=A0AAN6RNV7_9PEZI|nr:hypothetical protein C8A05DRAFT_39085 [Staphylotrichum longicolle]